MTKTVQLDCEYTKENLMEVQKPLHKKTAKICTIIAVFGYAAALVGAVCLLSGIQESMSALIFFGLFWGIFFTVNIHRPARKSTKATLKSHQKSYGETVKTTLKFYNSMVTAVNHQSGSEKKLVYGDFSRILRTKNILMLITEDKVAVMGDLRTAEPEDIDALWGHLLEQCPDAKIEYSTK